MTSGEAVPSGPWFVPPGWALSRAGDRVDATNLTDGHQLSLTGQAARAVLEPGLVPGADSHLASLSAFEPKLAILQADLAEHGLRPLDRAAVLRGGGYRLLFVELLARCNEKCLHCYAESGPHRDEALPDDVVLDVVADAARLGFRCVQLTGGDPLLSSACVPAARRAVELGVPDVEIYTNGLALTGRLFDDLTALPLRFALSFYSHDADTHDRMTATPGSHRRTTRTIRRLLEVGRPVRIGLVVTPLNKEHVVETLSYLTDLGIDPAAIGVEVQREVGRGQFEFDRSVLPDGTAGGAHGAEAARASFGGRASVSYDGTVYPCIFSRSLPLGSVHDRRLFDILSEPAPLTGNLGNVVTRSGDWAAQLSCWDCRLRAALLGPSRLPVAS